MNRILQSRSTLILFFLIFSFWSITGLKAQVSDTTLYDYNQNGGGSCNICGSAYNCFTSDNQSLTGVNKGKKLKAIKVIVYHTACNSSNFYAIMNSTDTLGYFYASYNCQCNTCFIDTIYATANKLKSYTYSGTNSFYFGGNYLCTDKIKVIRYYTNSGVNDAGISSVDSPYYACPGARKIKVTVMNAGINRIDSVRVNWKYNGVTQTPYILKSTLDTLGGSGTNKISITLGTKTLTANKKDTLIVWTSQPNGGSDTVNNNDTMRAIIAPSLGDTLTVGGSNPNYATIQGAINALQTQGICKSVVVNIRPGTYAEQLSIGKILGTDSLNTVTFRSSNGDSSAVKIYYSSGTSTANYTVLLNNSNDIYFKQLTLEAQGTSYGKVVELRGTFLRYGFSNCVINGINTSSTSSNYMLFGHGTINTGLNRTFIINKCVLNNGSYGIQWSTSTLCSDIRITNNKFTNQYYSNIYLNYYRKVQIENNELTRGVSSYSSGYGIYMESNQSVRILGNRIIQSSGASGGIYSYSWSGTSTDRNLIANNFISVGKADYVNAYAWQTQYCSYTDFLFNNTYTTTLSTGYSNIYIYSGNNYRFRNNSVMQASQGNVIYIYSSGATNMEKCNNNNYFSNVSGYTFRLYNTTFNTMADWQTSSKLDSASTWGNPNYKSSTNLHVYSTDLNGKAIADSRITTDIDGQTRNSSTPDIGADEFNLVPLDAGISNILDFKADSVCVNAVLKNNGSDTLKNVSIGWRINGSLQSAYSWSGTLLSGKTVNVCLGKYKFNNTTTYTVKSWSSQPNGQTDTINTNDTFTKIGKAAMSGIYTIGGSSPDYTSFNNAINDMVARGIIDSVKFRVRNGTYTEHLSIPKIQGAGAYNSIIFESENNNSSLVTLNYATNYSYYEVVSISAASGITFRKMTIQSTTNNGNPSRSFSLINGASNIEISDNKFTSLSTSSTDNYYNPIIYAYNTGSGIRILRNTFNNGATAVYLEQTRNAVIENNTFNNAYYMGVYVYYNTNLSFRNNTITSNSTYSGHYSFYSYQMRGSNTISGNKISGPNQHEYSGMYIEYIYRDQNSDSSYIFNNFISSGGDYGSYAFYLNYCENTYITHNNCHFYGTNSNSYAAYFYDIQNSRSYNNIFTNSGTGRALYLRYPSNPKNNFNNYFSNGSYLARINNTDYASIANMRSAGLDSNSIKNNPYFISNTDLHVQNVYLDSAARKMHFPSTDIDNETRNSKKPDIGADEFTPALQDAGVIAFISPSSVITADTTLIKVAVRNLGINTLYTFKVKIKINRDTLPMVSISDTLMPGDTVHVYLGKYIFKRDSINNLTASTLLPNGSADQKTSNDTFRIINKRTAMSGVYTIGGSSPDFGTFKAAVKAMNDYGIYGGVRFRVRSGTYTEQLRLQSITGAGSLNSVIFESENLDSSSVTLQYSNAYYDSNYVVFFNGCSGITFRKMTIKSNGTSYSTVFKFENGAKFIRINNNVIKGYTSSNTSDYNTVIASQNGSFGDEFNEIISNRIEGGSYGIYWYGYGSPNYSERGTLIQGNNFVNQYYMGIYMYYQTSPVIRQNTFTSTNTYYNYYGIYGIYMYGRNRIEANNFNLPGSSGYGMYLESCSGSGDTMLIANNMINFGGTNDDYGIYLYSNSYCHLVNNTVKNAASASTSSTPLSMYYGSYNQILNNIFDNGTTGNSIYLYSTGITKSDRNNYRSAGSNIAYITGNYYTDVNALKTGTQNDSNSLMLDPQFVSSSDLHVRQVGLNGKASPYILVKQDIDGQTRNTGAPDIGADEFNPPPRDLFVSEFLNPSTGIKPDTMRIKIMVRNIGTDTIKSFRTGGRINRDTLPYVTINRTIAPGDTAQVFIGKYRFRKDSINNLAAWTFNPNNSNDLNTLNDTVRMLNKKTALSGVYTIGGSSPDFPTFRSAVQGMINLGIVDYVRFRVRSGVYSDQIRIPAIAGAGAPNSIIFESENLDSTSVTLQYNSVYYDTNYVVFFDGASGVTFRKLKIRAINNTYSVVFLYENNARDILLTNNHIQGPGNSSTGSNNALIGSFNSSKPDENNTFSNNLLEGGSFGFYWYGYAPNNYYERKMVIRNNYFKDQYYMGAYLLYQNNITVDHNTFESPSAYYYSYPIYCYSFSGRNNVTANNIKMSGVSGNGIYIYGCSGDTLLVANNMVHMGNNGNSTYGIYTYSSSNVHLVNNTLRLSPSTSSNSVNLYLNGGSGNQMLNNIMVNEGPGYCMDIPSASSIQKSDRNDFRTAGTNMFRWNGTDYASLTALKSVSLKDSNSLSVDPLFLGSTNLHIKELALNGKATVYKAISTDIDGEARNSSTPDIGADEFTPPALDAGIYAIILPKTPFPSDSQFVAVVIKNYGINNLTGVKIDWKLNKGSQNTFNWTGNLASNDTIHVRLAKRFFFRDSAYSMKVWTYLPNGYNDTVNNNDTARTINQYPALSGVYTIGGTSPDFNTFTDAIDAMIRGGVYGKVTFNVRNGTYSEKLIIPKITGAGKYNSIVFRSESEDSTKVTLINSYNTYGNNYTLWLKGTNGITFKQITITATNSSFGVVANITEGSTYNTFTNCIIEGVSGNNTGTDHALIYCEPTTGINNSFNRYTSNVFKNGAFGIYSYGYTNGFTDKSTYIFDNTFTNPYYTGVYLMYNDTVTVSNNKMTIGSYSSAFGLRMEYCNGSFQINNNRIVVPQGYMGIYMYGCSGLSAKNSMISNNMVSVLGNGNNYGIYVYAGNYIKYYYNNFHINSTSTSSFAANISGSTLKSVNNIFDHTGNGYAFYNNGSTFSESNYNNYRSNGSVLAYWNGDRTTLSALKSANSMDNNSINIDPKFVSETNLHTRAIPLDKSAKPLSEVRFDIDGTKRDSLKPDIGADEFTIPSPNDAGISEFAGPLPAFSPGSNSVKVILNNYGSDTLRNATIKWKINGVAQSNYSWTGKIATGESANITIGSYNFSNGVKYTLEAWPTSPNGVNDTIYYNDTLKKTNIYSGLKGTYTIGGYLPDFKTIAEARTALLQRGVIDSVRFNIRNGTYEEQIEFLPYPGSSPSRPVVFTSEAGDSTKVMWKYYNPLDHDFFVVHLKGADNITLRLLTIYGYGNFYYNHVVAIDNEARNNTVMNNRIIADPSVLRYWGYGYYSGGIISGGDKDDSTRALNNYISSDIGIYTSGSGTASNQQETGLLIEGNKLDKVIGTGISVSYHNSPVIRRNSVATESYYYSTSTALGISNCFDNMVISHNTLHSPNSSSRGISVSNFAGSSSKKGNIFNNFITLNDAGDYGLYLYASSYCNVSFNSINLYGSNSSGTTDLLLNNSSSIELMNNIFCNAGNGYTIRTDNTPSVSNYNNLYTTGSYLAQIGSTNYTNLTAWKSASSRDANSKSVDPIFFSSTDLHTTLTTLDSAATPVSGITDDIDRNTRNTTKPDIGADEFNSLPNNLAITNVVNPVSTCLLDSQQLRVTVFNYGSYIQKNFPVRYRVNGGTVVSQTFTDSILPGASKVFSFSGKVNTKPTGTYNFYVWTDLNTEQFRTDDTVKALIRNYSIPDSVSTMSPANDAKNLDYPLSFSWSPSTDATVYDLYIWPDSGTRPSSPSYAGLTQIGQQIPSGLGYGTSYKWQVYARNPYCGSFGKVFKFTIRELPDMAVTSISSPSTAFSGTNVSVSWVVKNKGKGATGSGAWYDLIYLSNDKILDVLDPLLNGVINATSLNAGQSYSNSATVTLPNGIAGKYYIIVKTDYYNNHLESDEGNNISSDSAGMVVTLTPPPDLQVTQVVKPGTAFSGQSINIQYTVKNKGTGITRTNAWYDQVYLNKDSALGGTLMRTIYHTGMLDVDSQYKVNTSIALPFNLSGGYYVIVRTDVNNNEFEHAGENNNHRISDSIKIIQTPPPDLIVKNIRIKDSSSNRETVNLTYDLINQGGSATTTNWTDNVYFSRFSTFSTGTATLLASYGRSSIKSDDTLVASQNIVIPDLLNGLFYMFIMTDAYNQQFEGTKDTNNLSQRRPFRIMTPDLKVASVKVPVADSSGHYIKVDWVATNKGLGKNLMSNRQDKIYIARNSNYHKDSLTLIDSMLYAASLNPNDTIARTHYSRIPDGTYGSRYIYVFTDALNNVYENNMDTNNYRRSNRIDITLSPYPDLRTVSMNVPDTSKAGTIISVGYTVDNKGTKTAKAPWRDKVYISKDSVFNPAKVVLIQTNNIQDDLMIDSSYSMSQNFKLPDYISAGNYYFFIYTDANDALYEFQYEKNNIKRSPKVYVEGYPPIDLTVVASTIPDSIYSGSGGNFRYTVKNIGQAKTYSNFWSDVVYVSSDTFLDASDKVIGEVPVYTTLYKDSSYNRNLTFLAPNGFSGNYYVFFKTDWKRDNVDDDTLNNARIARNTDGTPKKMKIILSKSADLALKNWDVPSASIAGQPLTITWTVENKGDTTTKAGSWTDAVYLSGDYTIDPGDLYLGGSSHTGNLKKGNSYTDGGTYYLPPNVVGNYIVIIKTDNNNREYEHLAENNNTGASATKITIAPPGDLIVTNVSGPSTAAAGSKVTVSYTIKNAGSNPINGYRTDNVYLSADDQLDPKDALFATYTESASMIPNNTRSLSVSGNITGIKTGNYHFLVFTDIRNNINESTDTNNTNVSDIIEIAIPELPLKVLTKDTLFKNKELYYRLEIPDSLVGESILVTLKGDSINGVNEIYAKFDNVPSRSNFDHGFSTPFYGNQELIIPSAKKGTYYLMSYGRTTTTTKQNITLFAKKLEFEIRKINPKIGGNNGQVTMRIDGAKFDSLTVFTLKMPDKPGFIASLQIPDSTLFLYKGGDPNTKSVKIVNPTLAYVTFDLRGVETGYYDVVATKADMLQTTKLSKGFQVVPGTKPDIEVSVSAPSSTRTNLPVVFQVYFGNYGLNDYINGYLEVESNSGAPVSLSYQGLGTRNTVVRIPLEEFGGVKGLLRPGGVGTIAVYSFSSAPLTFNIVIPQ